MNKVMNHNFTWCLTHLVRGITDKLSKSISIRYGPMSISIILHKIRSNTSLPSKWRVSRTNNPNLFFSKHHSFKITVLKNYYFEDGKCRITAEFHQLVCFILLFLIFEFLEYVSTMYVLIIHHFLFLILPTKFLFLISPNHLYLQKVRYDSFKYSISFLVSTLISS